MRSWVVPVDSGGASSRSRYPRELSPASRALVAASSLRRATTRSEASTGFAGVACELGQADDLALALDPGGMRGRQRRDQPLDAIADLQREVRGGRDRKSVV